MQLQSNSTILAMAFRHSSEDSYAARAENPTTRPFPMVRRAARVEARHLYEEPFAIVESLYILPSRSVSQRSVAGLLRALADTSVSHAS